MSFDRFMREVAAQPAEHIDREQAKQTRRPGGPGEDLYAIVCLETRRCKIGRSNQVWQRIETLQACSPTRLVMFGHAPGLGFLEDVLHAFFAAERMHGEWFTSRATEQIASRARIFDSRSFVVAVEWFRARWLVAESKRAREHATFEWRGKRRQR